MSIPKKPASKRKAARRAPESPKRVEAVLQTLQTGLQTRTAQVQLEAAGPLNFEEGACLRALISVSPRAVTAGGLKAFLGYRQTAISAALKKLSHRGVIRLHKNASDPADVQWQALLPTAQQVSDALKPVVRDDDNPVKGMHADAAFNARTEWPRSFYLIGVAGYHSMTPIQVLQCICTVLREHESDLHDFASNRVMEKPWAMAAFLEALTIAEQITGKDLHAEWPRSFRLPGVAQYELLTQIEVLEFICMVLQDHAKALHDFTLNRAADRPWAMAQFAEVLTIAEQIACAGGFATELDDAPVAELSVAMSYNAHALVRALSKPARKGKGETH